MNWTQLFCFHLWYTDSMKYAEDGYMLVSQEHCLYCGKRRETSMFGRPKP